MRIKLKRTGFFLSALYFRRRSRIFQWGIPSTTSLHDNTFLLYTYQLSYLKTCAQPPRIVHICLFKNFTGTPRVKTKLHVHIPSCNPANSIKSALISLNCECVHAKQINQYVYWNRRCQLRSFHAHFLLFVKPAATFRGEILITRDISLWIPV